MQMRRGWAGLVAMAGIVLAGCEETPPGDGGAGEGIVEAPVFQEDTVATVNALTCPAVSAVRARVDTVRLAAGESRVVQLEGDGRQHSLWIWSDDATRTIVLSEMRGTQNGVEIEVEPDPTPATLPWAMLSLDAGDCRGDGAAPIIVKRHDDGVYTVPDGGFDERSSSAFAVLRGNSGYMLATPTKDFP